MKLTIDTSAREVTIDEDGRPVVKRFDDPEAFAAVSHAWLQCGWDTKHVYTFSWLGRPIIQLPEDLLRIQEVIHAVRPDVIIETGVAHGGSLVFYASLCKVMGVGRVVGIELALRPHNRDAILAHPLASYITIVDGSSVDPAVVDRVRALVAPGEKILVLLDSNHSYDHVLGELDAYSSLVSPGSYIVATDGIMKDLVGAPRSAPDWAENNPFAAARAFLAGHPEFVAEPPPRPFDESVGLGDTVTYWPGAWLRRR